MRILVALACLTIILVFFPVVLLPIFAVMGALLWHSILGPQLTFLFWCAVIVGPLVYIANRQGWANKDVRMELKALFTKPKKSAAYTAYWENVRKERESRGR